MNQHHFYLAGRDQIDSIASSETSNTNLELNIRLIRSRLEGLRKRQDITSKDNESLKVDTRDIRARVEKLRQQPEPMDFSTSPRTPPRLIASSPSSPLRKKRRHPNLKSNKPDPNTTSWLDLSPDEPFNFLGLPKEVRLLIYELLPTRVTHQFVVNDCIIEVTDKCCNPAILSTCRLIHNEAHQLIFDALRHDGPRLHLTFRGLNVDHILHICDKLQPNQPRKSRHFRDPDDSTYKYLLSKTTPFDTALFELRSYMRTPKDYEAHIDWIPTRHSELSTREFLRRFIWDLGRMYCLVANRYDYTVSVFDGDGMIPLVEFLNRRIPATEFGRTFHDRLMRDRFVTWRDIICRPAGRRATDHWLWKHY